MPRFQPHTAMPCTVTAFSVKIASQGDWAAEVSIAREVICEWNASHASTLKQVLVPQADDAFTGDLLIAFLCALKGGSVESEIAKHVEAGKPAFVYFSGVRTDFAGTASGTMSILEELRNRYGSKAAVDSFGDEKEFRAKLTRQLGKTIETHPYFKTDGAALPASRPTLPETHPPAPELSKPAQVLLMSACDDPEAYIGRVRDGGTLKVQVNGRQLVDPADPASAPMWESAFQELWRDGLIRDAGCNGRLFQISPKGFEFLETLGKYPIGYIAELGGF